MARDPSGAGALVSGEGMGHRDSRLPSRDVLQGTVGTVKRAETLMELLPKMGEEAEFLPAYRVGWGCANLPDKRMRRRIWLRALCM